MSESVFKIVSKGKLLELVLTDSSVVMQMAKPVQDEISKEMEISDESKLGGLIGRVVHFVVDGVKKLLDKKIEYKISEIKSIEWTNGSLIFTYEKRHLLSFESINVNHNGSDIPALKSFEEEDVKAFVEQFNGLKSKKELTETSNG